MKLFQNLSTKVEKRKISDNNKQEIVQKEKYS